MASIPSPSVEPRIEVRRIHPSSQLQRCHSLMFSCIASAEHPASKLHFLHGFAAGQEAANWPSARVSLINAPGSNPNYGRKARILRALVVHQTCFNPGMSIQREMARKFRTRKQTSLNTTAAKHYEFRNGPAQTQAPPGQYVCRARNGTPYKPDLLLLAGTALNTVVPTSTQKPIDASEGDRLYTRINKQQQNARFAKKCFLASRQKPELSQPIHLSPAADPHRIEPRGKTGSDPCTRMNQYHRPR